MTPLLIKALRYAAEKHKNQRRSDADKTPYINHPLDVVSILLLEAGITDEETLVAAALHDTVEDETGTTYEDLCENFGKNVADIVMELTDDQDMPNEQRYAMQLKKAETYSTKARQIRLADKTSNLRDLVRSPPEWSPKRLQGHLDHAADMGHVLRDTHKVLNGLFDAALKKV